MHETVFLVSLKKRYEESNPKFSRNLFCWRAYAHAEKSAKAAGFSTERMKEFRKQTYAKSSELFTSLDL